MADHPIGTCLGLRAVAQLDVSAASAVVCVAQQLYVIADDLLELAVYDLAGVRMGSLRLLAGELPDEHAARKAQKPDFEALVALPDGSLLALGSGSTPRRQRGVWLPQLAAANSCIVDLSELYGALAAEWPELNIEGAAVLGPDLFLCSRGNGARGDNLLVQLELARVLEGLQARRTIPAESIVTTRRVHLPALDGVPLSLTDLTVHDGSLVFCAAAEASANTYDDGACAGTVIGRLSSEAHASDLVMVARDLKLEGICSAGAHTLYAVADADDPAARAPLLAIEPWKWLSGGAGQG